MHEDSRGVLWMNPWDYRRFLGDYVAIGLATPAQVVEKLKRDGMWPRRLQFARTGPCPLLDGFDEGFRDGSLFGLDRPKE